MSGGNKAGKVSKLLAEIENREIALEAQHEELLNTQQQSALSMQRYRVLFDAVPVPVFVVDRQGMALECNLLAQQWLEIEERPALPSNRLLTAFDRSARPHLLRLLDRCQVDASVVSRNLSLTLANGSLCHVDQRRQKN